MRWALRGKGPGPGAAGHRGDGGLTTLEWLLVVAAVAGLAAVAVVVVQNVVAGTAERVESHSARQQAAELAASVIDQRWKAADPATEVDAAHANRAYGRRCRLLGIIYADIALRPDPKAGSFDASQAPGWSGDPGCTIT